MPKDKDWPKGDKWDGYYFFGGEDYELVFSLPKKWAKDLLLKDNNFFDSSDIKKLILRFEKGEKKLTYKIWTIIMFMAWQNKFF